MINIINQSVIANVARHYDISEEAYNIIVDIEPAKLSFNYEDGIIYIELDSINIEFADNVILFIAIRDEDRYTFGTRW